MNLLNSQILFWLGLMGILFYVLAPVVFPTVPNLRQPELLPVYTLMMGLGQLLKGPSKGAEGDSKNVDKD